MQLKIVIPLCQELHRETGELLIFCDEIVRKTYIIKCLLNCQDQNSLENKIINSDRKEDVIKENIKNLNLQIDNFINDAGNKEIIEFINIDIINSELNIHLEEHNKKLFDVTQFQNAINIKDICLEEDVGHSEDFTIYHSVFKSKTYACKLVNIPLNSGKINVLKKELKVLKMLETICYQPVFSGSNVIGILLPYYVNKDLRQYLNSHKSISDKQKFEWMLQICNNLSYLHSKNIVHNDIKCSNILLDEHLTANLADFGSSYIRGGPLEEQIGTFQWMAPERFNEIEEKNYLMSQSDIYSLGITFWEILTQELPFKGLSPGRIMVFKNKRDKSLNLVLQIKKEQLKTNSERLERKLNALIKNCTWFEKERRFSLNEIIRFINSFFHYSELS